MPFDPEGHDRAWWLKNNANIVLGEGGGDDEVFYNQIETRLGFDPEALEGFTMADERLADAYINCLARYEAEGDGDPVWTPRSMESLVAREGVTVREAGVIVIMAAREYPTDETRKEIIKQFFSWLHTNTDTFDPVMVGMVLKDGDKLGFTDEEQAEQIDLFLSGK